MRAWPGLASRPPLGAAPLVEAVPADVGAGAATVGHHVVGGQADPAQPAGLDGARPGRSVGQALLIRHGRSPPGLPAAYRKDRKRASGRPGRVTGPITTLWQSRTSRPPAQAM